MPYVLGDRDVGLAGWEAIFGISLRHDDTGWIGGIAMPTYKNNTTRPIHYDMTAWAPGAERRVSGYIPDHVGLTLTDTEPVPPSPILVSENIVLEAATPQTVAVPYAPKVRISAQTVGDATATISIGGKSITLSKLVGWESVDLNWDTLGALTLASVAGATVYLLIEKVI